MKSLLFVLALCPFTANAEFYLSGFACRDANGKQIGDYNIYQLQPDEEPAGARFLVVEKMTGQATYFASQNEAFDAAQFQCEIAKKAADRNF